MKAHLTLLLFFTTLLSLSQTSLNVAITVDTSFTDYSGTYQLGPQKNGRLGKVTLLHDTSGKILFYIYLDGGKPSEHEGQLYGQFRLKLNKAIFTAKCEGAEKGCKWSLVFTDSTLTIKTINEQNECGFGYGVTADGTYKRKSSVRPEYFIDESKDKIYFRKTTPNKYNTCR
jgi:hypothetical protein